jgi:hypothetical protein
MRDLSCAFAEDTRKVLPMTNNTIYNIYLFFHFSPPFFSYRGGAEKDSPLKCGGVRMVQAVTGIVPVELSLFQAQPSAYSARHLHVADRLPELLKNFHDSPGNFPLGRLDRIV